MHTDTANEQMRLARADSEHSKMREHIAVLQEQLLGYELMRAAGEAALTVGNTDVFGMYSARPHDNGVLMDALTIAQLWPWTYNAEDFAIRIKERRMVTSLGVSAVECIIDHWDLVQPKLVPFKEPKRHIPGDETEAKLDKEFVTEAGLYEMFLSGESPQALEFREWVTEEVLPTIRKTGKYDHDQSAYAIPKGFFTTE